jgi:hypothetical protein
MAGREDSEDGCEIRCCPMRLGCGPASDKCAGGRRGVQVSSRIDFVGVEVVDEILRQEHCRLYKR